MTSSGRRSARFAPLFDLRVRRSVDSWAWLHESAAGGFRLGARHSIFCVGCCWALMLVMFAAGVASLVWVALLTALMVHEKTGASGARTVPVTGVTLLAISSTVLLYSAYAAGAI